jgi:hypothetical protein
MQIFAEDNLPPRGEMTTKGTKRVISILVRRKYEIAHQNDIKHRKQLLTTALEKFI